MWLEILLASALGLVIYWFVSGDKEDTLPLGDGWWGPGARPTAPEDESIRPFKVETSDEELNVRPLFPGRAEQREAGSPPTFARDWGGERAAPRGAQVGEGVPAGPSFVSHLLCGPSGTWGAAYRRKRVGCPSSGPGRRAGHGASADKAPTVCQPLTVPSSPCSPRAG